MVMAMLERIVTTRLSLSEDVIFKTVAKYVQVRVYCALAQSQMRSVTYVRYTIFETGENESDSDDEVDKEI